MASKPPIKLSKLLEEVDGLTSEQVQQLRDLLCELGEGCLGNAYVELTERVGRDTALSVLLDILLDPVVLPDGREVARRSIGTIAPNKLQ